MFHFLIFSKTADIYHLIVFYTLETNFENTIPLLIIFYHKNHDNTMIALINVLPTIHQFYILNIYETFNIITSIFSGKTSNRKPKIEYLQLIQLFPHLRKISIDMYNIFILKCVWNTGRLKSSKIDFKCLFKIISQKVTLKNFLNTTLEYFLIPLIVNNT